MLFRSVRLNKLKPTSYNLKIPHHSSNSLDPTTKNVFNTLIELRNPVKHPNIKHLLGKIVNGSKPLTIFAKSFVLDL